MITFSAGLRNGLMGTQGFKTLMDGKVLNIYTGPAPSSADDALWGGNVKLCTVTESDSGTGITFQAPPVDGTVTKTITETWSATVAVDGTPAFFRIEGAADAGGSSTDLPRVQGSAGPGDSDLELTSSTLTVGESLRLGAVQLTLPAV